MSEDDTLPKEGEPDSSASMPSAPDVAGAALGALSASEDAEIRAAAAANEQVARDLAELQIVAAELARVVPSMQINRGRSAGIRSRLISKAMGSRDGRRLTRDERPVKILSPDIAPVSGGSQIATHAAAHAAASTRAAQRGVPPIHPSTPHSTITARSSATASGAQLNWPALAAGLAFVLTGVGLIRVVRDRDHLRTAVNAQQTSLASKMTTLQALLASKDSLIVSLTGPNMKVVDLVNYASQDPIARMFWDQKTQEWTMYAYNLRQPKPGKVFQVWLITNTKSQPISAGTFTPDAHGYAVLRARYPLERSGLQKVAVSEEPQGGVPSPTGPIVIAGSATSGT